MPGDEKLKKEHEESDSDEEDELEVVPQIDIDVTKLSALSPEVISKQVRTDRLSIYSLILEDFFRLPLILVRTLIFTDHLLTHIPRTQVRSAMSHTVNRPS